MHARIATTLLLTLGCAGGNDNAGSFGGSASTPTMPPVTSAGSTSEPGTTAASVPTTGAPTDTTTTPDPSTGGASTSLPDPSTTAAPPGTSSSSASAGDTTTGAPDSTSLPDPSTSTTDDSTTGNNDICDNFCNGCSCPSNQCIMCCAMKDKVDVCNNGKCGCF